MGAKSSRGAPSSVTVCQFCSQVKCVCGAYRAKKNSHKIITSYNNSSHNADESEIHRQKRERTTPTTTITSSATFSDHMRDKGQKNREQFSVVDSENDLRTNNTLLRSKLSQNLLRKQKPNEQLLAEKDLSTSASNFGVPTLASNKRIEVDPTKNHLFAVEAEIRLKEQLLKLSNINNTVSGSKLLESLTSHSSSDSTNRKEINLYPDTSSSSIDRASSDSNLSANLTITRDETTTTQSRIESTQQPNNHRLPHQITATTTTENLQKINIDLLNEKAFDSRQETTSYCHKCPTKLNYIGVCHNPISECREYPTIQVITDNTSSTKSQHLLAKSQESEIVINHITNETNSIELYNYNEPNNESIKGKQSEVINNSLITTLTEGDKYYSPVVLNSIINERIIYNNKGSKYKLFNQNQSSFLNQNNRSNTMTSASVLEDHQKSGWDLIQGGQDNFKGLAYTHEERKQLGILGLIPPAFQAQDLQVELVMNFINNIGDELNKYIYLRNLKDYNERLFYKTLTQNVEKLMPIVYTPTVGLACQKFSHIYMRPRGLYITIDDLGTVSQVLKNWPEEEVKAIVVTDGERILGLGDLGVNGMGISIGKLSLYTALAGISPKNVLPITIDVGTNNESLLKDPLYMGLRQKRVRGEKYDQLLEEFMQAVVARFGRSCLIQFEDFANHTAFDLLRRYKSHYCTFNDDIQGTASVSLSGLFSAAKITSTRMGDHTYLFFGAGEANLGTAHLLVMAMIEYGVKEAEAKKKIWLVDSRGLVVKGRDGISGHKEKFVQDGPTLKSLEEIIDFVKPTALIGASAQGGAFNETVCSKMAKLNDRPIIFALSNPTSKAECTAEQAYNWTQGRCVFASGSPFDPVQYQGRTFITGQGNNAYIFPGIGLAVIAARVHTIPEDTFLVAAKALSDQLSDSDIQVGLVYPSLTKIRNVTLKVATRVFHYFYAERIANYRPEPQDKLSYLRNIQYNHDYGTTSSLAKLSLDSATRSHQDKQTMNKNGAHLFTGNR